MGSKIYVGGLPYAATEQQLSDLFAQHGTVASARVITDKFTGQSRGFGFVEMSSDEEAQKAIAALNGTQMDGRTLTVNEARPQEPRSGGGGGRGGFGGGGGGGRSGGGGGGGNRGRWESSSGTDEQTGLPFRTAAPFYFFGRFPDRTFRRWQDSVRRSSRELLWINALGDQRLLRSGLW